MPVYDESRVAASGKGAQIHLSHLTSPTAIPTLCSSFPSMLAQADPTGSFALPQMDSHIRPSLDLACLKKKRRLYRARVHRPCRT
jgi:hypothetical protein